MRRVLLGDPTYRYSPSVMVKALEHQFQAETHQGYLLPGQTIGKLLFIGKQSIIFYPVIDTPMPNSQELSIAELFSKCHQEFIFEFFLKSRSFRYLIFPTILHHRQHWVSLIYDIKHQNLSLLDSGSALISKYQKQEQLLQQFRQSFQNYGFNINHFNYISQGLQKDNVHCGAWALANILTTDHYGLTKQLKHIEKFYQYYLNPKLIEQYHDALQFVLISEEDYDDDFVVIDATDLEENHYEEMSIPDPIECVSELLFELNIQHFLPSPDLILTWESHILSRINDIIHHEPSIIRLMALRDNVRLHQHSLHASNLTDVHLKDIIIDINHPQANSNRYQIKDPHRQIKRFVDCGFSDWITQQSPALQVIYEALLHDACSYEPMLKTLMSNAFWASQYDLTQHYLSYYKQIEQRISIKVIQQLMLAKPDWMVYANIAPPTLDWLSHLLLFPQYHHQLTSYILDSISQVMLDFDSMTNLSIVKKRFSS